MKEIVQQGDPVLRKVASYVKVDDITGKEVQLVIKDMKKSLATQNDGVAIAAPQIGVSLQIFVVAPIIFKDPKERNLVYINPEITYHSPEQKWLDEGCLSCRWKVGQVQRSVKATIRAYNERGELFEESADGLLAHIFQHETDHLHGILFVDKARGVRDMTEAEIKEVTG
jgi:peptide deformylase